MNYNSYHTLSPENTEGAGDNSPILIVPYQWIGDFVRCHSVVKLLRQRFPSRPVDMLALPPDAKIPVDWPLPELKVSPAEAEAWR